MCVCNSLYSGTRQTILVQLWIFFTLIEKIFLSANDHLNLGNIPYVISRIYFIGCCNTTQFNTSRYFESCEILEHYEMAWLKKLFPRLNIYILLFVFQCFFLVRITDILQCYYNIVLKAPNDCVNIRLKILDFW